MHENFVNSFLVRLDGKITDESLKTIRDELSVFALNYDIKPKSTEVMPYMGYLPECYKVYMVTMKVEGMSVKSLLLYHLYLNDFFRIVNKKLEEITANDIRLYLYKTQEERNISNRSLDSRRSVINAFMDWCCNEEYIPRNPCRNIKPIKYEVKERNPLTAMELEKVRDACSTLRDKAIIEFMYSTGCRVTELINLNKSDVDYVNDEVVLFGKGNKHRVSYLNARSKLALINYLNSRNDESNAVFVSERLPHGRLTKAAVEKVVREIGKRSGIDRALFPHLIRHTTATDCLDRGMDVTHIQKMLGHADVSTTMIYAKVSKENVKNEHKKCIV